MIVVKIDNIDRSGIVEFNSVKKSDVLNSQVDNLSFDILVHPAQTFTPEVNSEVVVEDNSVVVFGGVIQSVDKVNNGDGSVSYTVNASDFSFVLDRVMVNESYSDFTAGEIIESIIDNYAPGFTYANVNCALVIKKISFSREKITDCFKRLADITGYSFYVDYEKDIHFFSKNSEPAPFNITDTSENYIIETLNASNDISQLRNRVFIRGGEIEGEERTETFNGDGVKKQFKLSNKFAHRPVVFVGAVEQVVGIDYLDDETLFDCLWDFNQQYLRFKDTTIPAGGTNNITATAKFLYNLVVQVDEPTSISEYGIFEYSKSDNQIKSRETAIQTAKAELTAYKDGLIEGGFETYTPGLRSGQIISVNSVLMGVNENFLIQKVSFKMISNSVGVWQIQLATLRTVSFIDLLLNLLSAGGKIVDDSGDAILEKTIFTIEQINFSEVIDINSGITSPDQIVEFQENSVRQDLDYPVEFCWGEILPNGYKRPFILDLSPLG